MAPSHSKLESSTKQGQPNALDAAISNAPVQRDAITVDRGGTLGSIDTTGMQNISLSSDSEDSGDED